MITTDILICLHLQGLLLRGFSVGTMFALAYWIAANIFVLYGCAGCAAQVDVMNIRLSTMSCVPHMYRHIIIKFSCS